MKFDRSLIVPAAILFLAWLVWSQSNQNQDDDKCPGPDCPDIQPVDPPKPEPKKPSPRKPWGEQDKLQFEVLDKDKNVTLIKVDIPKSVGEVFDKVNVFLDGGNNKIWWGAFISGAFSGAIGLMAVRFVLQKDAGSQS